MATNYFPVTLLNKYQKNNKNFAQHSAKTYRYEG